MLCREVQSSVPGSAVFQAKACREVQSSVPGSAVEKSPCPLCIAEKRAGKCSPCVLAANVISAVTTCFGVILCREVQSSPFRGEALQVLGDELDVVFRGCDVEASVLGLSLKLGPDDLE